MNTDKTMQDLRTSAHRVWLAGLGALAMAEQEGQKLFKSLVDKGETMETRGKDRVEQVRARVHEARERGKDVLGKVGHGFDDAMVGALNRMGVPSRDEIATLTKRVEELTASVEKLTTARSAKTN